ncbi:MAG TPA: ATP-grasp domain-containing protein, partial [Sedimentisphaerales bacterium]|nr:ATP-grasp domain-containing protein [Sedimentisphaerales bacterium]
MVKLKKSLSVLFTCVGRRVSLVNSFKLAAKKLKTAICVCGADMNELSPAMLICDKKFVVKSTSHQDYIKDLLSIVKKNKIDLIVPTVDLDLRLFAASRDEFSKLGCLVLVSSVDVVDICQDKRKTYKYLTRYNFDTPVTAVASKAIKRKKTSWPCFLKPWDGYASRGNAVVNNRRELLFYAKRVPNCIVQEFIKGVEYTCDVYVDFDMKVKCVVPRIRLEVRSGEV